MIAFGFMAFDYEPISRLSILLDSNHFISRSSFAQLLITSSSSPLISGSAFSALMNLLLQQKGCLHSLSIWFLYCNFHFSHPLVWTPRLCCLTKSHERSEKLALAAWLMKWQITRGASVQGLLLLFSFYLHFHWICSFMCNKLDNCHLINYQVSCW